MMYVPDLSTIITADVQLAECQQDIDIMWCPLLYVQYHTCVT